MFLFSSVSSRRRERTVEGLEVVEAGSRSHISFLSLGDVISLYLRTGSPLLFDRR
jgi:hypothetical protein